MEKIKPTFTINNPIDVFSDDDAIYVTADDYRHVIPHGCIEDDPEYGISEIGGVFYIRFTIRTQD
jgi:hypothetical protein